MTRAAAAPPVALQVGAATVRVARVGPDGAAVVLETDAGAPPPVLLAGLVDGPVDGAPVVVDEPAALLAADLGVRGPVVVLDVRAAAGGAVLVRDGLVRARRHGPGGRHLDVAVAALLVAHRPEWAGRPDLADGARRVREAASLQPDVDAAPPGGRALRLPAAAVREVLRGPLGELVALVRELAVPVRTATVLVTGGVARTPLLAELLDAAGLPDVRVAARPEAAAVLAALARARAAPARRPVLPPAGPSVPPRTGSPVGSSAGLPVPPWAGPLGGVPVGGPGRVPVRPSGGGPAAVPAGIPARLPPAPRSAGRLRAVAVAALAVVLLAGLHLAGARLAPAGAAAAPAPVEPAGLLVQYDYRLVVPAGWAHTGGRPERRRVLLTPVAAPQGSDLVVVESSPLGYDAGAEPERAAAELRDVYDAGVRAGGALSGYDDRAVFAGRAVTAYTEVAGTTTVRWFVLLDGSAQLSVGCRSTPTGTDAVLAACAAVVAGLRRT